VDGRSRYRHSSSSFMSGSVLWRITFGYECPGGLSILLAPGFGAGMPAQTGRGIAHRDALLARLPMGVIAHAAAGRPGVGSPAPRPCAAATYALALMSRRDAHAYTPWLSMRRKKTVPLRRAGNTVPAFPAIGHVHPGDRWPNPTLQTLTLQSPEGWPEDSASMPGYQYSPGEEVHSARIGVLA
jgi:hypothetical protein